MNIKVRIGKRKYTVDTFGLILAGSLLVALIITVYAFRYVGTPYLSKMLFFALLSLIIPIGMYLYYKHVKIQNKEYYFPQFLKDLADGVRAGLSLPQAVMNVSKINYGALTEDVKKLATHISWGVPFDEAIRKFADRTGSKMIKSSVDLIIEAYAAGGGIADILDTVAEDAAKIHSLREERKTRFSGFISTMYAVYIIFLVIVVILTNTLIPEIPTVPKYGPPESASSGIFKGLTGVAPRSVPENELIALFFGLAMIEAVFSGLLAGVAGEGSVVAGIKHALVLVLIGIFVFQIFVPFPDPKDRIARAIAKMPVSVAASVNVGEFFVENNITSKDILQNVNKYLRKMNLPSFEKSILSIRFEENPQGCEPCAEGKVDVNVDSIIVNKPTYLSFVVRTDPARNTYVVYVS